MNDSGLRIDAAAQTTTPTKEPAMDPLTEFAVFLFSWMFLILAVSMHGRKAAAWLRKWMMPEPVSVVSAKPAMRIMTGRRSA